MSTVARCNAAFAALGAGLVHLSLSVGAGGAATAALGALAAAELVWAIIVLARGRVVAPRTALVVTAATAGGFVLAVAGGLVHDPLPALAAGALQLVAAAIVAASLPAGRSAERPVSAPRAVGGLLAGALLVSILATPALSASSEGTGDMGGMMTSTVISGHDH